MELILWRHAEAEDGSPDEERRLTPKGEKQAEKMAAWLKDRIPKNTSVIASPTKRTRQTVEALTSEYTVERKIRPGASVTDVLNAAGWPNETEDEDGAVIVVGHQPYIGEVAAHLLSRNLSGGLEVKKGAVWWFSNGRGRTLLKVVVIPSLL